MTPIVSVVVPTKNRYKYLTSLISMIEGFNDSRVELLVHDNSDDNTEILDFLSGKTLVSTKYYYDSEILSMGENAERGINKAKGEYICFIGDDDAVCRNIADCAEWMKQNDVDVVRPLYAQYAWNEDKGVKQGSMYFDDIKLRCKQGDPIKELKKVLNDGVPEFERMTKIYHGIVRKDVIKAVQNNAECLFPGPTPDMSGAVSIAFYCRKYAMIEVPVVLPGMSRMVGGGVMGKVLTLDEVKFITDDDRRKWPTDFPPLWATELIWPVCALNALKSVGRTDLIEQLNINKMYSRLIAIHRTYIKESFQYCGNKISFFCTLVSYFIKEGTTHFMESKILSKLNGKLLGKYNKASGFASIADAEAYLMNQIKDFSFDKLTIQ